MNETAPYPNFTSIRTKIPRSPSTNRPPRHQNFNFFNQTKSKLLIKIEEGDTRKCLEKKNGNFAIRKLAVSNNRWWVMV